MGDYKKAAKATVPTFYEWIIKYYIDSDSPAGDLARDMQRDSQCPKTSFSALKRHIIEQGGNSAVIATADEMWRLYKQCYSTVYTPPVRDFYGFVISSRLFNLFRYNGIKTIDDVLALDAADVIRWRGAAERAQAEVNTLKQTIENARKTQ